MIKIRLQRKGGRNKAFYRIVAMDHHNKLSGEALDIIGYWHPAKDVKKIDKDKLKLWTQKGAFVTPAVKNLLVK